MIAECSGNFTLLLTLSDNLFMMGRFFPHEEILSAWGDFFRFCVYCADIQTFDNMMGDDGGHLRVGLDKKD